MDSPKLDTKRNWLWQRRAASHALRDDRERGLPPPGSGSARAARSSAPVSRSGVWLIGGTLLLAIAVLVWAFAGEIPGVTTTSKPSSTERPRPAAAPSAQATSGREPAEAPPAIGIHPPGIPTYSALLSRDVFQPLVVAQKAPPPKPGGVTNLASPPSKEGPDTWHGWRFNGLAQMNDATYALVEQPENRRSNFVKEGDHLEDAKIISVGPDVLVLQEAAGDIAHVRRVDAMAELMRTMHGPGARSAAPAGGVILPGAGTVPVLPGSNPAAVSPGGVPNGLQAPTAVPDGLAGRRDQRRRQRQGLPGEE